MSGIQKPQQSQPISEGESKRPSLADLAKTPEWQAGLQEVILKNNAKPPIYSPGYVVPEK